MNRRARAAKVVFVGITALLLLLLGWVTLAPRQAAPTADLAVTFLGITNNPTRSPPPVRLEVIGTNALCAVFRITNLTTNCSLQFDQESVEQRDGGEWVTASRTGQYTGIGGSRWSPRYSCLYAVSWPADVPTNGHWRAVITVKREALGFRQWVNDHLGYRDLFDIPTYGAH